MNFDEAWRTMEAKGYRYGRDALEQVRFGWELCVKLRDTKPICGGRRPGAQPPAECIDRYWCATSSQDKCISQVIREAEAKAGLAEHNRCGCNNWCKPTCPSKGCPWQGKRPVDAKGAGA